MHGRARLCKLTCCHLAGDDPKGSLDLSLCTDIRIEQGSRRYSHLFSIITPNRNLFLSAPGKDEMQQWMSVIESVRRGQLVSSKGIQAVPTTVPTARERMVQPKLVPTPSLSDNGLQRDSQQGSRRSGSKEPAAISRPAQRNFCDVAQSSPQLPQQQQQQSRGHDMVQRQASSRAIQRIGGARIADHKSKVWFYGVMDRGAAEVELQKASRACELGLFLVRQSPSNGSFVLSWLHEGITYHTQVKARNLSGEENEIAACMSV